MREHRIGSQIEQVNFYTKQNIFGQNQPLRFDFRYIFLGNFMTFILYDLLFLFGFAKASSCIKNDKS